MDLLKPEPPKEPRHREHPTASGRQRIFGGQGMNNNRIPIQSVEAREVAMIKMMMREKDDVDSARDRVLVDRRMMHPKAIETRC
jgi:hypothetical protein